MVRRAGIPAVIAALAAVFLGAAVSAVWAAPVESYGRLPSLEDVSLSPNGARLAFVRADGDDRFISVLSLGDKAPRSGLRIGTAKLRALSWADDNHLLLVSSRTGDLPFGIIGPRSEFEFAFVYDIASGKLTQLHPPSGVRALDVVVGIPFVRTVDGHTKIFFSAPTFNDGRSVSSLFNFDLETKITHVVDDGRPGSQGYMVDGAGNEVAENLWTDSRWQVRLKVKGGWQTLPAVMALEGPPAMMGLGPQGQAILFAGLIQGRGGWHALSLEDGSWQSRNYAGDQLITDDQTGLALGLVRETDHYIFNFFDPAMQKTWDAVLRAFPGEQVDFVSVSRDHKKLVVKVFGQTNGAAYLLVDINTGHADLIGDMYDEVPPEQVANTRSVSYTAGDGLIIPAYLTLPKGRPAKGLPLVVLAHGGPAVRDELEFDWMAQALASRGYAVLQPEYRGSGQVSNDLFRSGFGQWGRKMQTDLSDGVRFLAAQGVIDPKRVCIAGASYGGYAALAGVTLDPGVYRCAVDVSGLSDLKRFVQWSGERSGTSKRTVVAYWDRYMQAEAAKDPTYAQISPIKHIDQIMAPLMIIHGRDDTVVPFEQSQWMADAMKAAGKPVEFVPLVGEDHWMSRSETRQKMLTAMVGFIEKNNPADPPASAAANR